MFRRFMDALLRIEKRIAVGIIGLLLAIPGVYLAFHEKRPQITYDIVSEINVLDVNAPVADLVITYRGMDIAQRNLNLRVVMLRLESTGEVDITQNMYDAKNTFGIKISSGQIVESPRIISSNSRYVAENLHPQVRGNDTISLDKIILDRGKYAILEIRILHARGSSPTLIPVGKIAGVERIPVTRSFVRNNRNNYLSRAFGGGFGVNLLRVLAYPAIALLLLFLAIVPVAAVTDIFAERKRKLRRKEITAMVRRITEDKELRAYFVRLYARAGARLFSEVKDILNDEKARRAVVGRRDELRILLQYDPLVGRHRYLTKREGDWGVWQLVRTSHATKTSDGDILVTPEALLAFDKLEQMLLKRGLLAPEVSPASGSAKTDSERPQESH